MTLHEREHEALLHTYRRLSVEIVRGEGMYLYDVHENAYLDFLGGVAVNALGYGHPDLLKTVRTQIDRYIHVSNYFVQEPQVELAERLKEITGFSRVFFCNSGTEAIEGAMKLARKWGAANGRDHIISMQNSFHGRTFGSLSMMSNDDYRDGFGPYLEGCVSLPLNDSTALEKAINSTTTAVILEPIQGEGGIIEVSKEYAQRLMTLKSEFGFLLLADEVQSGIGRTGKFLACEHYGLHPDIVTLAKPLGGGLPLGAILVSEELKNVLQPGNHGTTFGGNPVACAAGNVVVQEVVDNGLMRNTGTLGSYFQEQLIGMKMAMPDRIKEVRGKGLMVGIELTFPGKTVTDAMLERGIIINCTHINVLRFVPPLIVERKHIDTVCTTLNDVLGAANITNEVSR